MKLTKQAPRRDEVMPAGDARFLTSLKGHIHRAQVKGTTSSASGHQPSVGMLLCQHSKGLSVEYALRATNKPIGVADRRTKLVSTLPKKLQGLLPSVEQIEEKMKKRRRSNGK